MMTLKALSQFNSRWLPQVFIFCQHNNVYNCIICEADSGVIVAESHSGHGANTAHKIYLLSLTENVVISRQNNFILRLAVKGSRGDAFF